MCFEGALHEEKEEGREELVTRGGASLTPG
jgi:hypothetical protein